MLEQNERPVFQSEVKVAPVLSKRASRPVPRPAVPASKNADFTQGPDRSLLYPPANQTPVNRLQPVAEEPALAAKPELPELKPVTAPAPVVLDETQRALAEIKELRHSLDELRKEHEQLNKALASQINAANEINDWGPRPAPLKKEQLEQIRQATVRASLDQQHVLDELEQVREKFGRIAVLGFLLAGASLLAGLYAILELRHLLP